jgi:hypothetical protein
MSHLQTVKRKGIENQLINNRELSKLSVLLPEPSETHIKFGQGSLNGTLLKMSNHSEDKGAKKNLKLKKRLLLLPTGIPDYQERRLSSGRATTR